MPLRRFPLSPRALRFFVVALALLQLVAPTWHICEMGGHVAAHPAGSAAAHHQSALAASEVVQPNGPLICYCAPHSETPESNPNAPQLSAHAPAHHPTCLAMLLQTMPAQMGTPPVLEFSQRLIAAHFAATEHRAPLLATPRRFRGRAPPRKC